MSNLNFKLGFNLKADNEIGLEILKPATML
jgi:hypothetical protein